MRISRELVGGLPGAIGRSRQEAVVDEHAEQLLDEQRVALGGGADPGLDRGRQSAATGQGRDQPAGGSGAQRLEEHGRRELAVSPARARIEQLRAGRAEEQDGRVPAAFGDVLEQVEQGRLGPVDVLDDDDQRAHLRDLLEEPADRPGDLFLGAGVGRQADRTGDAGGEQIGVALALEPGADLRRALSAVSVSSMCTAPRTISPIGQ